MDTCPIVIRDEEGPSGDLVHDVLVELALTLRSSLVYGL